MSFIEAILIVLAPCVPLILPGIFFIRGHRWDDILISGARIVLWSMSLLTLLLSLGLFGGVSVQCVAGIVALLGISYAFLYRKLFFSRHSVWHLLSLSILVLLPTLLFSVPFLQFHEGLPTGDIQKSILFAQESVETHRLPNYGRSVALLNRDPVDFYTPGLHAVTALVLSLSPFPVTSIGLFSILIAVCVAILAAAITREVFDAHWHLVPPFLAFLFTLTQYRFLRYLREPGYHFQNVVGELFLFGMVLLFIRFLRRREKQDAVLFIVCGAALFLSHQFSAFIAVFMGLAMILASLIAFRAHLFSFIRQYQSLVIAVGIVSLMAIGVLFALGLGNKIPSIFTRTPHLMNQLPSLTDYPATMGEFWFFMGSVGIILMLFEARRKDTHQRQVIIFGAGVISLFLLSQGPAIGIDIPPVRALFYLAVPLSIGAAYLTGKLFYITSRVYHGNAKRLAQASLAIVVILATYSTTARAFGSLSHSVRTNSTITPGQLSLIETLKGRTGGVLIDDYDRRSASWLVLSGVPMFTRIAADLRQQMEESQQSKLRNDLYLRQLDYEKIVELGSLPGISSLAEKHAIRYITGIQGSSNDAFSHNSILHPIATADDTTLYEVQRSVPCTSIECIFLLKPSTLANDIGDPMDTFEHLQASIRSPRLSDPLRTGSTTYRQTDSPIIPLSFNVRDYVRVMWDPNSLGHPETGVTFMLWLTKPVPGLLLQTPSGEQIPLPVTTRITIHLPASLMRVNNKGFMTLSLLNPSHEMVPIDLVALGPSLVP